MIAAIYIEQYEDLIDTPQTINLGGKYLYAFERVGDEITVTRTENEQYVEGFFNISDSECKVDLVSAIVGENGVGKTRIINSLMTSDSKCFKIVIYEKNKKVIIDNYTDIQIKTQIDSEINICHEYRDNLNMVYYSPHFSSKKRKLSEGVNISLETFIKDFMNNSNFENWTSFSFQYYLTFMQTSLFKDKICNLLFKRDLQYEFGVMNYKGYSYLDNTGLLIEKELINKIILSKQERINDKSSLYHLILLSLIFALKNYWELEYEFKDLENDSLEDLLSQLISTKFNQYSFKELKKLFDDLRLHLSKIEYRFSYNQITANPSTYVCSKISIKILDFVEYHKLYINLIKDIFILIGNDIDIYEIHKIQNLGLISIEPPYNLSDGESAILNIYSLLYFHQEREKLQPNQYTNTILFLDEADLGFHPTWKKRYLKLLLETIPYFFEDLKYVDEKGEEKTPSLQIIFTTHDPLTLSDMPNNNVVFLKKDSNGKTVVAKNHERPKKTFGANITDILANSFFVEDGLIGDFAKMKIEQTIKWINDQKKERSADFDEAIKQYSTIVRMIDEPVIRRKLMEMIAELMPAPINKKAILEAQLAEIQRQLKELDNN